MKLALPLLLFTLALCCPDANAGKVCPALNSAMISFLMEPRGEYQRKISNFEAPEEAVQAAMEVKTCVDKMPRTYRLAMANFVKIVEFECKMHSE